MNSSFEREHCGVVNVCAQAMHNLGVELVRDWMEQEFDLFYVGIYAPSHYAR